jgi:TnpA family transposase
MLITSAPPLYFSARTCRARQAPYHTIAIPPSGEAAYVIDGLVYREADLSGVSDHNFGLARLLGFCFAPRIPNLSERRLYTFGPKSTWPVFEPSSPAGSTKS